ncbi:hypothetical protein [Sporosarcina limicola]|uniref:Uncharacterized protein n=1 Tax=Sporosarcina limicola TaxID=34101 RepID=A0A927MLZ2_9BACL|nr:hypothetical protein [Sporosarcina limicola]MBE1557180.1 hypothetical protein [Sporosarcina limicola]
MKQTIRARMLGVYDLFLATGAIWIGAQMVRSRSGIFAEEYPDSWASSLPFESWVMPGVLTIVIFGLGNIVAAVFSFKKSTTVRGIHLPLWEQFSFSALFSSALF